MNVSTDSAQRLSAQADTRLHSLHSLYSLYRLGRKPTSGCNKQRLNHYFLAGVVLPKA